MAKVEVTMPQMGESITEGTVITWRKRAGDVVEQDEILLEIGTDKVDTDVPAPESGVVAEILVEEGNTVDVGTVLAVIETDATRVPQSVGSAPTREEEVEAPAAAAVEERVERPVPADAVAESVKAAGAPIAAKGPAVDVVMPKMGESIIEGTIIAWHKKAGDAVEMDEVLLEIATDKVDTEVPSPAAGVLQEILVPEGETVDVGTVIARIGGEAAGGAATAGMQAEMTEEVVSAAEAQAGRERSVTESRSGAGPIPRRAPDGRFFSPLVRSIAESEGLSTAELEAVPGSGRGGRVTKADLVGYLAGRAVDGPRPVAASGSEPTPVSESSGPSTTAEGRVEIIEMDRMRQIISEHMIESKRTSAHVTSFAEVDVTGLVHLRESRKQAFQDREGVKLTFTPFFVKSAVDALRDHPLMNASVDGTRIIVKKDVHVGIAVALGRTGLVVPVIRHAGDHNITGLARAAATLAEKARSKQLQPDDLQGGTFTVTNVGSLGSLMGTPIISQPQVAILATGAIKKRPVVIEDARLGDVIAVRHMMFVSLSYDHRIIDGAMASSYLQRVAAELEAYGPDSVV